MAKFEGFPVPSGYVGKVNGEYMEFETPEEYEEYFLIHQEED